MEIESITYSNNGTKKCVIHYTDGTKKTYVNSEATEKALKYIKKEEK